MSSTESDVHRALNALASRTGTADLHSAKFFVEHYELNGDKMSLTLAPPVTSVWLEIPSPATVAEIENGSNSGDGRISDSAKPAYKSVWIEISMPTTAQQHSALSRQPPPGCDGAAQRSGTKKPAFMVLFGFISSVLSSAWNWTWRMTRATSFVTVIFLLIYELFILAPILNKPQLLEQELNNQARSISTILRFGKNTITGTTTQAPDENGNAPRKSGR